MRITIDMLLSPRHFKEMQLYKDIDYANKFYTRRNAIDDINNTIAEDLEEYVRRKRLNEYWGLQ